MESELDTIPAIMADDTQTEIDKSEDSPEHNSSCEQDTWIESVNKALPEVNINIFEEAMEIAEKTFKNIKKNYGS